MKKQVVVAFLLGLVLPLAMLELMKPDQELAVETEETEHTQPRETRLRVLCDNTVTEMELEEYITGVVLSEMPADFCEEALKAQAVVARTYALKRLEQGSKHEDYSLCDDPSCCQGYRSPQSYLEEGGTGEGVEKIAQAVEDTAGLVLKYEGKLIDATYFSCSGGRTEAAVEVWGADVPYLQAVDSPGEEIAAHDTDEAIFALEEFARLTGCAGDPNQWVGKITHTQGGGVDTIELCGQTYEGTELRKLLGLRSTDFTLEIGQDRVTVTTRGFGHRVGMSQYGAEAMARQGSSFREILSHYYPGTELVE